MRFYRFNLTNVRPGIILIDGTDHIVQRYGAKGTFLWYPEMSLRDAEKLLEYAERHWC